MSWATANMLNHKYNKTKLMLFDSIKNKHLHNLSTSITVGNAQIPFKLSVNNFSFIFYCRLTTNAHFTNIFRTCYFELRRLACFRIFMKRKKAATLLSDFARSRIDYCYSLLCGYTLDVTSDLQRKQNNAARVISRLPMSSRITIILNHFIGFQTKYFVWDATFIAVLQHPMSLTCCRKGHHIPTTLAPGLHSKWCQVCPIKVIIEISFEDILVWISLQRLNFLFDHCTYVHGLAL